MEVSVGARAGAKRAPKREVCFGVVFGSGDGFVVLRTCRIFHFSFFRNEWRRVEGDKSPTPRSVSRPSGKVHGSRGDSSRVGSLLVKPTGKYILMNTI